MAFNNLKTLKLKELKGSQFAGVGNVFADPTSQSDFRQISTIKHAVTDSLTFTGGLPYPDSIVATGFELSNGSQEIKPSTMYPAESDSDGYLCVLNGLSAITAGGTSVVKVTLSDGSTDVVIGGMSVTTTPDKWLMLNEPIYFTEDLFIKVTELATNTAQIDLAVGIVSRGGNPQ
jgi:hypothetical protein